MIRFSIGVSLLVLTAFIGINQYFDNTTKLEGAQSRLERTKQKVMEIRQFSSRLDKVKRYVMEKGQDQPARIEKLLDMQDKGLTFELTSSPRPDDMDTQAFYRHEFQITGQTTFFDLFTLINTLESTPGFVVNYVCFKCENMNLTPEEGREPTRIRGFLNIYNPERV